MVRTPSGAKPGPQHKRKGPDSAGEQTPDGFVPEPTVNTETPPPAGEKANPGRTENNDLPREEERVENRHRSENHPRSEQVLEDPEMAEPNKKASRKAMAAHEDEAFETIVSVHAKQADGEGDFERRRDAAVAEARKGVEGGFVDTLSMPGEQPQRYRVTGTRKASAKKG
jgi:hypothetical protein